MDRPRRTPMNSPLASIDLTRGWDHPPRCEESPGGRRWGVRPHRARWRRCRKSGLCPTTLVATIITPRAACPRRMMPWCTPRARRPVVEGTNAGHAPDGAIPNVVRGRPIPTAPPTRRSTAARRLGGGGTPLVGNSTGPGAMPAPRDAGRTRSKDPSLRRSALRRASSRARRARHEGRAGGAGAGNWFHGGGSVRGCTHRRRHVLSESQAASFGPASRRPARAMRHTVVGSRTVRGYRGGFARRTTSGWTIALSGRPSSRAPAPDGKGAPRSAGRSECRLRPNRIRRDGGRCLQERILGTA